MVANPLTGITAGNLSHAVALQGRRMIIIIIVPILQMEKPSLRALLLLASAGTRTVREGIGITFPERTVPCPLVAHGWLVPCPGHCPPHHIAFQPVEFLLLVDGMSYEFMKVNITNQEPKNASWPHLRHNCTPAKH